MPPPSSEHLSNDHPTIPPRPSKQPAKHVIPRRIHPHERSMNKGRDSRSTYRIHSNPPPPPPPSPAPAPEEEREHKTVGPDLPPLPTSTKKKTKRKPPYIGYRTEHEVLSMEKEVDSTIAPTSSLRSQVHRNHNYRYRVRHRNHATPIIPSRL
ncbi:hypothetical protein BP00DRAFT_495092 [Aspergillus indologenus CBS 114.80]|uniref:Uncharacterized protein n=1 Tax=Aspergillus indologenus CBS 114.80 TaxID=1450541 RepID=A0A2V5I6C9_9EURO|nr:hypothetical protein BP00DRAFT_495092 [Aspergillus indologenus CBS 114.80]